MSTLSQKDFESFSGSASFKSVLKTTLEPKHYAAVIDGVHYETELLKLQAELVDLQQWVAKYKKRVCVISHLWKFRKLYF